MRWHRASLTTPRLIGSGHFAADGKGKSAYVRHVVFTDPNGTKLDHDPKYIVVSDQERYTVEVHYLSGEDWGSYVFVVAFGGWQPRRRCVRIEGLAYSK